MKLTEPKQTDCGQYTFDGLTVEKTKENKGHGVILMKKIAPGTAWPICGRGMTKEKMENLDETKLSHLWEHKGESGTGRPVDGKPIKGKDREGEAACGGLGIAMMINEPNREGEANCIFDKNMLVLIKENGIGEEATVNYGMDPEIVKRRYNYEVVREPGALDHIQMEYPENIDEKIKSITRKWQKNCG